MSKDENMDKEAKLDMNKYMAFRPPLEQWIEEDREKKWKEAEAAGTIKIIKRKFYPEFYIPVIGLTVGAGILGYRMSRLKYHKQVGELPNYLIYTRLAVQGTIVLSFVAFAAVQTGRFLNKRYDNNK